MSSRNRLNRRRFLTSAAAIASVPCLSSSFASAAPAKPGPNARLTLGFIGMGKQSRGHLQWALNNPQIQVVAVCDVHDLRLQAAVDAVGKKYREASKSGAHRAIEGYRDFRELLARED